MPDIARYYNNSACWDSPASASASASINHSRRFQIVLCELHNPTVHGYDEQSDPEVAGHYLIHSKYDCIDSNSNSYSYSYDSDNSDNSNYSDEEDENECDIYYVMQHFKSHIRHNIVPSFERSKHPFIRNYKMIVSNENYIKPEIAECLYLSGEECVAILKTFWLRLVQRAWRRVFNERKQILARRMRPDALRQREIHGKWVQNLPGLHGMLVKK